MFSTTDRWQEAQDADFDYGVIHLSSDLGAPVGSFSVGVLPDEALKNRLVNVSGYPFEPGEGKAQYFHANRVKALTGRRLFYDIDTMGGQSGSPVWAYEEGSDVPVVVAIHAYGVGGVPSEPQCRRQLGPACAARGARSDPRLDRARQHRIGGRRPRGTAAAGRGRRHGGTV